MSVENYSKYIVEKLKKECKEIEIKGYSKELKNN